MVTLSRYTQLKPCIFEWVYLAREESTIHRVNVNKARARMGEYLAQKVKRMIDIRDLDYIIPVPDTSKPVALEISKQLNKPYVEAITKIDMLIEPLLWILIRKEIKILRES